MATQLGNLDNQSTQVVKPMPKSINKQLLKEIPSLEKALLTWEWRASRKIQGSEFRHSFCQRFAPHSVAAKRKRRKRDFEKRNRGPIYPPIWPRMRVSQRSRTSSRCSMSQRPLGSAAWPALSECNVGPEDNPLTIRVEAFLLRIISEPASSWIMPPLTRREKSILRNIATCLS